MIDPRPIDTIIGLSGVNSVFVKDISFVPHLGIVFAFISKNASSLLKTYLSTALWDSSSGLPRKNPHELKNTGFLSVDDLGLPVMNEILTDASTPRVVLGRNPVDRLLSGWRSRVHTWHLESYQSARELTDWLEIRQRILGQSYGCHAAPARDALTSEIPISMLVEYVEDTPSSLLDRHFAGQAFLCGASVINYDLVGQLEDLDTFIKNLEKLVGQRLPSISERSINRTPTSVPAVESLDSALVQRIEKRFVDDYNFFGYPVQAGAMT